MEPRDPGEPAVLPPIAVPPTVTGRPHRSVVVARGDMSHLAGTHERIRAGETASGGEQAVRFAYREATARTGTPDVLRAWRRPVYEDDLRARRTTGETPARGVPPACPSATAPVAPRQE
ncbi:hypothetical protein ABZ078_00555 [Streptomyces sp. NPDC006385]|uniref:hypothetical protein n=1 Tax=Streptomyces sp. NPDC006385 TaxID=3156761 RepID=UPI0033AB9FDE